MNDFSEKNKKIAVIAGAGPAGMTAALELLKRTDITPIVFESDTQVGGISKTIVFKGNRMDLGGHRFFSKSDWVMRWWQEILPLAPQCHKSGEILQLNYHNHSRELTVHSNQPVAGDSVMLIRRRLSRILYRRRFFSYPLKLDFATLRNLGFFESMRIGISYGRAQLRLRHPETSLEDFLINRFGSRLYLTFFKDYTEKVWGVDCRQISAEWGVQRIKGLSITKAIGNALARRLGHVLGQKNPKSVETSLIEQFLYPKLGPGQMWEAVSDRVVGLGGTVRLRHRVVGADRIGDRISAVDVLDLTSNTCRKIACDYFISTLPVQDLVAFLRPENADVSRIAEGLPYRAFITVGLLVRRMKSGRRLPDNWIYVQEPDVRIGRVQVFNNWSPSLVADPETIWLGLEYFCDENDELWAMTNEAFLALAAGELEKIGLVDHEDVLDGTVVRVPKAYPAYFGSYGQFHQLRDFLDRFSNLYPIGRNGMHRYNNQDHSMLTAKAAVDAIKAHSGKAAIWNVNTEDGYHEENVGTTRLKTAGKSL